MNPKFKKFLEENPDITMLGLSWALYWRLTLLMLGIYLGVFIVLGVLGAFAAGF